MNKSPVYSAMQATSKGMHENNDCCVFSLAIACGMSYENAHATLAAKGRKPRQGTLAIHVTNALKVDEVTQFLKDVRTIRTLQDKNLKDCYIILTSQHMLCMKDGIVHDWTQDRLHRIQKIYRVKKSV
jgi:hypothetical protein